MPTINLRSITPATIAAADKKPGYADLVYFCAHAAVTAWAPTLSNGTPGATKRILTDHTITGGVLMIQAKAKSIDATSEAAGEAGGQVLTYKYKVIVKGDSPEINELLEAILNEDLTFWFNDPVCGQTNLVQIGSKCTPANISGFAFRSGNRGAGGFKEYEFSVDCPDKFWYEGALEEANTTPVAFKYGVAAGAVPDADDIDAATDGSGAPGATLIVPAEGFGNTEADIVFMAEPATEPAKTKWFVDSLNKGNIGVGETFLVTTVGDWRVYYTAADTTFDDPVEFRVS